MEDDAIQVDVSRQEIMEEMRAERAGSAPGPEEQVEEVEEQPEVEKQPDEEVDEQPALRAVLLEQSPSARPASPP